MLRAEPAHIRYQVLRPFDDYQEGDLIDASGWPWGRARQMTEQRYLLPIAEQPATVRRHVAGKDHANG